MENISPKLIEILNYRIEQEEYSSRLYRAMSMFLDYKGYESAAKLWKSYSNEELVHADYAYNYLLDVDILPVVPALTQPQLQYSSLVDIINISYDHEQKITKQCQMFALSAMKDNDFMALKLAQKYLEEQQEELSKVNKWVNMLETFGTSNEVLLLIDNKMKDGN